MATLIDKSYFIGERHIAQLDYEEVEEVLQSLIDKYEPIYLKKVLGYELFKLFTTGLADANPAERWVKLRDGAEYTDEDGNLTEWTGLKNDEKVSPIANLVYYWHCRNNSTYSAATGETETKPANGKRTSVALKEQLAWNEMVDLTADLHKYLSEAKTDQDALVYPEFDYDRLKCVYEKINLFNL